MKIFDEVEPVAGAQGDIDDGDIWLQLLRLFQRSCGVVCLADHFEVRFVCDQQSQTISHHGMVIDNQDFFLCWVGFSALTSHREVSLTINWNGANNFCSASFGTFDSNFSADHARSIGHDAQSHAAVLVGVGESASIIAHRKDDRLGGLL